MQNRKFQRLKLKIYCALVRDLTTWIARQASGRAGLSRCVPLAASPVCPYEFSLYFFFSLIWEPYQVLDFFLFFSRYKIDSRDLHRLPNHSIEKRPMRTVKRRCTWSAWVHGDNLVRVFPFCFLTCWRVCIGWSRLINCSSMSSGPDRSSKQKKVVQTCTAVQRDVNECWCLFFQYVLHRRSSPIYCWDLSLSKLIAIWLSVWKKIVISVWWKIQYTGFSSNYTFLKEVQAVHFWKFMKIKKT